MRQWLSGTIILSCVISGCSHIIHRVAVEYVASAMVPAPVKVKHGGDFALFYDDDRKPEIPIRLHAGELLGFAKARDGRMQAVAGEFRMNLSGDVQRAYWKRLNTRDD
jgi:hypothetical protein